MTETEVLEAEVVPEEPTQPTALAVTAPALAVTPQVEAAELVARLDVIREAQAGAMQEGVDYGVIPGTNKPALLKPGAEKLGVLFQLDVQVVNDKTWGPGDHLTVTSNATVYHAPTRTRLGSGEGLCSTREKKYGKRRANRICPTCGVGAIRTSKNEGEGFYCWRKIDGCGAQFPRDDERITSQTEGEIDNPELADTWNTVTKMAAKRARIDAILAVTGASALFTQDVDDQTAPKAEPAAPAPAWADEASPDRKRLALDSLAFLLSRDGGDPGTHTAVATYALAAVKEALGVVPEGIAVALSRIARVVQEADTPPPEAADPSAGEPA